VKSGAPDAVRARDRRSREEVGIQETSPPETPCKGIYPKLRRERGFTGLKINTIEFVGMDERGIGKRKKKRAILIRRNWWEGLTGNRKVKT